MNRISSMETKKMMKLTSTGARTWSHDFECAVMTEPSGQVVLGRGVRAGQNFAGGSFQHNDPLTASTGILKSYRVTHHNQLFIKNEKDLLV